VLFPVCVCLFVWFCFHFLCPVYCIVVCTAQPSCCGRSLIVCSVSEFLDLMCYAVDCVLCVLCTSARGICVVY
jgi:hypothetical protein